MKRQEIANFLGGFVVGAASSVIHLALPFIVVITIIILIALEDYLEKQKHG